MPRSLLVLFALLLITVGACATRIPSVSQPDAFGHAVVFDSKGVEFGPWLRQFFGEIRRHWFVPYSAMQHKGHVVVTFRVRKDGTIDGLSIKERSTVAVFNDSALAAVAAVKKTAALPAAYPSQHAVFTVTFYYNEASPQEQAGGQPTATLPSSTSPIPSKRVW